MASKFLRELRSGVRTIEDDCKALRHAVELKSNETKNCGGEECVLSMLDQLQNDMDDLEGQTQEIQQFPGLFTPFSFSTLISKVESLYLINEQWLDVAEFKLEQYGYQRPINESKCDVTVEEKPEKKIFKYHSEKPAPSIETHADSLENPTPPILSVPLLKKETPPPSKVKVAVKTPTLEDFGISASSLQLIAEKQKGKPKPLEICSIVEVPEITKVESPHDIQKALNFSPPCTPIITPSMFPLDVTTNNTDYMLSPSVSRSLSTSMPVISTPTSTGNILQIWAKSHQQQKIAAPSLKPALQNPQPQPQPQQQQQLPFTDHHKQVPTTVAQQETKENAQPNVIQSSQIANGIRKVEESEWGKLQSFIRNQLDYSALNMLIDDMNEDFSFVNLKKEKFSEDQLKSFISTHQSPMGSKVKCILLILMQLKRIQSETREGKTLYCVV